MSTVFGGDQVQRAIDEALETLGRGELPRERRVLDLKEEAGRRSPDGTILPGSPTNERAARALAPEVACMANTPGGGALVVGVADDGTLVGADLDADWLQVRLYQLLQNKITTVVLAHFVGGHRLLVVRCPPAVEPIPWQNKIRWRVGDQCQEIDPSSWHERRIQGWGYDWSSQQSPLRIEQVRPSAIEVAKDFLRATGDDRDADLADATTPDFLRRLGGLTGDGFLTNAGALVFVGRETAALDYLRRPAAGADSEARVQRHGRSLLEEIQEVFTTARAYNPEVQIVDGLAVSPVRVLPERAIREAIVNGVVHREWTDPSSTLVEHVGATIRVLSPGGFHGGVRPDNIINHPSESRNPALADIFRALRIAERQGIGVDRMFGDMVRFGHPLPLITEQEGGRVLVVLAGERPDVAWVSWLREISPDISQDLRMLMTLFRLIGQWWTDTADLAPFLQVTEIEARQVVERVRTLALSSGAPVTIDIDGTPTIRGIVVGVTDAALNRLRELSARNGRQRTEPSRATIALAYATHAGRISTTELASIVGAHATNVGSVLRGLEEEGLLHPSRENRRGPGFYYRLVEREDAGA